jgi:hypothetical protein
MHRVLAVFSLPLLAGCAAVLGTKQKEFDLRSDPAGAEVYLDGTRIGTTPALVKLSNMKEHTFVFRKEGFKETSCTLTRGTGGGWVIFDVLTGLVPIVIDAATNSWSQTQGKSCTGQLEALPRPMIAASRASVPADQPVSQIVPPAPAQVAPTPVRAVSAVAGQPDTVRPVVGVTKLPLGTNYVGDTRIRVYYPLGCAAQHGIPADFQVFFQTADGATRDGFVPSGDC